MSRAASVSCVLAALLSACQTDDGPSKSDPDVDTGTLDGTSMSRALPVQLVAEKKLSKLLPTKEVDHYEASGIVASGGTLYVASDNLTNIAAIDTSLNKGKLGPGEAINSQYEAITASDDGRFFAIIEPTTDGDVPAEVDALASDTAFVDRSKTDTTFDHANKGFEGVAWLRVSGSEYLLALCENNDCKDDDSTPGEGRVKLLAPVDGVWATQKTLKLPELAGFLNYSDIALRSTGDGSYAVLVVSRKSAMLWLGTLSTSTWAFTGASNFYSFPRDADGAVRYCSVEGVTFLGPQVIAAVSDKSDGSKPCTDEEESIHIFQLPQ
ncbi:MAG TPA: hypothetical protein VER11_19060 [Polyangiaceae bacterium]|nr:hypothetical protein [Polyangiaceae bacterium]